MPEPGASRSMVSIQLVSPASGERRMVTRPQACRMVSIQLVSPASGETRNSARP